MEKNDWNEKTSGNDLKVLFLTMQDIRDIKNNDSSKIYVDLINEFALSDSEVTVVSPYEKRNLCADTELFSNGIRIVKFRCGNITKNKNLIKKGFSVLMLKYQYLHCLKKNLKNEIYDLILYSTPPITLYSAVAYMKRKTGARTYLMLKDIWPHDMLGHGMLSESSLIYKAFLRMERKLYNVSDNIGCMSAANVEFVKQCYPDIYDKKLGLCPNSICVRDTSCSADKKRDIRRKYNLPTEALLFVYGGSLGRPQGIDFIIDCLTAMKGHDDVFFTIVGGGAGYEKLDEAIKEKGIQNAVLIPSLPYSEYEMLCAAADVGLIFLNHNCSVPNIPSRVLSYTAAKLPVFAATDTVTDIGKIITDHEFGWWCESNNVNDFCRTVHGVVEKRKDLSAYGENGFQYMLENWNVKSIHALIVNGRSADNGTEFGVNHCADLQR